MDLYDAEAGEGSESSSVEGCLELPGESLHEENANAGGGAV